MGPSSLLNTSPLQDSGGAVSGPACATVDSPPSLLPATSARAVSCRAAIVPSTRVLTSWNTALLMIACAVTAAPQPSTPASTVLALLASGRMTTLILTSCSLRRSRVRLRTRSTWSITLRVACRVTSASTSLALASVMLLHCESLVEAFLRAIFDAIDARLLPIGSHESRVSLLAAGGLWGRGVRILGRSEGGEIPRLSSPLPPAEPTPS